LTILITYQHNNPLNNFVFTKSTDNFVKLYVSGLILCKMIVGLIYYYFITAILYFFKVLKEKHLNEF